MENSRKPDDLNLLLSMAKQMVDARNFKKALIWAQQLSEVSEDESSKVARSGLVPILVAIISGSATDVLVSSLKSANRGDWQMLKLMQLHKAAELLVALSPDDASNRIILAQAKSLIASVEESGKERYVTDADDLEEYLDALWDITFRARRTDTEPSPEIIGPADRVQLSAVVLNNAKSMLFTVFAKKLSEWKKAKVLCEQVKVRLLPGLEIYHVKSATASIDTALAALEAQDYGEAQKAIAAAELTMRGYTWRH